jgi:hypothetical protein
VQPLDVALLANRDHGRCHDVAGSPLRGVHRSEKLGIQRHSFCKQGQPPVTARLATAGALNGAARAPARTLQVGANSRVIVVE